MPFIAYARVSTDNQREEGTIRVQEHAITQFAHKLKLEIQEVFRDDGVSGGLESRPGLAAMFDYLEDHPEVEGILIFKLDRLARNLYIQEHLIQKIQALGKRLISTREQDLDSIDPVRIAFRQFMGMVSELEKAFITMRLSEGRLNKARKGKYAGGGVPIGYRSEGKDLILSDKEQEIVSLIFQLKRHQRLGLRQIAAQLNEQAIPTARGGKWHAATVKYILNNPIYNGHLTYRGIESNRPDLVMNRSKPAPGV